MRTGPVESKHFDEATKPAGNLEIACLRFRAPALELRSKRSGGRRHKEMVNERASPERLWGGATLSLRRTRKRLIRRIKPRLLSRRDSLIK